MATRYLVKIGRQYLERVEKLRTGTQQILTTQYKYDAADAGTERNAKKVAEKVGGIPCEFDTLNGEVKVL